MISDVFFLDFEASSLLPGGYPIEVAWVSAQGEPEQYLIKPTARWLEWSGSWSPESEAVHGIPLATLLAEGTPVEIVATRLVEALAGQEVYSDDPGYDQMWLALLLEAGGRSERILLLPCEHAHGTSAHRALPDAESNWRAWQARK